MAISGVLRAGSVQIRVTDMQPALHHYTEVLGLRLPSAYLPSPCCSSHCRISVMG